MKAHKGSFTVEAACIFSLILMCICVAIWSSIALHEEIRLQIIEQEKQAPLDTIKCMYRREFLKEVFGEWDED